MEKIEEKGKNYSSKTALPSFDCKTRSRIFAVLRRSLFLSLKTTLMLMEMKMEYGMEWISCLKCPGTWAL